ncbi:Wzz/FepE/Etk N-terminal domain-containing protein [Actinoplanes awajinensis]|uniref:Lipopolysaccharide biosynthesis protein n=1 Tax=Actinoplanes awajinensis subsp. mycoplanecinus TaxID=135947 RepID=A0A0X3UVR7_9ACTN|nr:Wzz/FepE/Etk N-terminal domain-containing protein [Actinoplanes awajinensis]KUL36624.1 lipopolysaccharide biosynthesis protein [Actinoplanes awajinensis subsp. mycoplanecinus]
MEASRPPSSDIAHYLGAVRRHWWIALVATAAGLGVGTAVTQALPRTYESSSSVLVQSVDQDVNAQGGRTKGAVNLDTEAQLIGSGAVATKAAALLRTDVSPVELAHSVSVQVPANTTVLVITFKADAPMKAQAGSHAFAEAYLRNREETARAQLDKQIASLNLKVKQLTGALTGINARLAIAQRGSSTESNLQSLRSNSQNQLNNLTGKLNELTTTTVGGGSIISDARVPEKPSSPNTLLDIATGGMIGLLVGLALAYLRERFDRRLVTAVDVRDRGRVPVLAALDERTTPHFDDVLQPYGPGGRVFNRLRNEVLASLEPTDRIIVVTGTSRGSASTLVAANLAAALARTGSDVVLIGAHLPDSVVDAAPLARMLGVAAVPGLSELLAGRVGLVRALQRTPRIPSLRVITTGGSATAAGLMQSQRLRDTLEALSRQGGYVVIEAPSTSSSADAQSLASFADAAILAVELRRTRRPALLDATEQLQRVGTRLLGAVVLPRLTTRRAGVPSAPAVTLPPPYVEPLIDEPTQQLSSLSERGEPVSAKVRPRPVESEPDDIDETSIIGVAGPGATDGDEK